MDRADIPREEAGLPDPLVAQEGFQLGATLGRTEGLREGEVAAKAAEEAEVTPQKARLPMGPLVKQHAVIG